MSQPSPDARHLARAVDALTTQVRRIADTVSTPVAIVSDAPTTTADDTQPTLRDQHRATWNTLTPTEQAARLAALDTDDDAQRTARRASLRIILDRASRGVILRTDEAALLRAHVDAEQHEADVARAVAADHRVENRALREKLERRAQEAADEMARLRERATLAEARASQAEDLQRVAHETSNRSEAERATARTELEQAQAAIDRVRALHRPQPYRDEQTICTSCSAYDPSTDSCDSPPMPYEQCPNLLALDGTEQPTTR